MSNHNRPFNAVRVSQILHEDAEAAVPDHVTLVPQVHTALASVPFQKSDAFEQQQSGRPDAQRRLPSAHRTRWAGANLAVLLLALLALTSAGVFVLMSTRNSGTSGTASQNAFVPEGKVRHVVISYTKTLTGLDATGEKVALHDATTKASESIQHTQDLWYTRGTNHPLLYLADTFTNTGSATPRVSKEYTWIDEDEIYRYSENAGEAPGGPKTVQRSSYRPDYFELYGPDPDMIDKMLNLPGGHLIGNSVLNGRPVADIETASTGYPPDPLMEADVPAEYYASPTSTPEAPSNREELSVTRWRLWIDKDTLQPLRWQHSQSYVRGPRSGQIETQESNVLLDETRDLKEFSPNYFAFSLPPGSQFQEYEFPTHTAAPSPTPIMEKR
ncbi:MAG: hypothetical protein ABI670_21070 [Chloroflexota bacterium]